MPALIKTIHRFSTAPFAAFDRTSAISADAVLHCPGVPHTGATKRPLGGSVKRISDLVLASLALIAVAPIFVLVAVCVRFSSPGPVFFRHTRIGYGGVPFKCTKFRTMHLDAGAQLKSHLRDNPEARAEFEQYRKLRNDPRIIPLVGNLLRQTSLDELPQLLDVLSGHMSLVGPRPVTREEVRRYGEASRDYLSTRPGITGLWQVSGRNTLNFDQRVAIDSRYVHTWSLLSDFVIMLRTVKVLISRDGAC